LGILGFFFLEVRFRFRAAAEGWRGVGEVWIQESFKSAIACWGY
jgi:hypothetical protein